MKKIFLPFVFLCLLLSSCKKDEQTNGSSTSDNNDEDNNSQEVVDYTNYYFSAKIDNEFVSFSDEEGYFPMAGYSSSTQGETVEEEQFTTLTKFNNTKGSVKVIFIGIHDYYTVTCKSAYEQTLALGDREYGTFYQEDFNEERTKGVAIQYVDSEGTLWNTQMGSGDQSNSSFKLISVSERPEDRTTGYYKMFTAEFSCTLYNEKGDSIELKNGEIITEVGVCDGY